MTNHPKRRPAAGKVAPPSPDDVKAARLARGMTQVEAAEAVFSTGRAWQLWEAGDRRMHPAIYKFFVQGAPATPEARAEAKEIAEKLVAVGDHRILHGYTVVARHVSSDGSEVHFRALDGAVAGVVTLEEWMSAGSPPAAE